MKSTLIEIETSGSVAYFFRKIINSFLDILSLKREFDIRMEMSCLAQLWLLSGKQHLGGSCSRKDSFTNRFSVLGQALELLGVLLVDL